MSIAFNYIKQVQNTEEKKYNIDFCVSSTFVFSEDPRYGLVKWINEKKDNALQEKEITYYNTIDLVNVTVDAKDEILETNKEYTIKCGDSFHKGELILIRE